MAKKKTEQGADVLDNAQEAVQPDNEATQFVQPSGVMVRLRENHPQDSYGRAGMRFGKEKWVEIGMAELSHEQLEALLHDDWLQVEFISQG